MPQQDAMIAVSGLRKAFSGRVVVKDISLNVRRGEVFGFLGPNGSGKTTTLRMLCGLLTPDAGRGTCLGYDILTESFKIKRHVGYMTQHYSFYTDLTVEENLNFIAAVYHLDDRRERVYHVMEMMNLLERRNQLTRALSGGWKQRVALSACLLHSPALLLLDEPTAGIDPIARREFWDRIHELSERGVTTLMSTHYMDEAERCTRLAYIAYGDLMITGSVSEMINATNLKTWEIRGEITTSLLQEVRAMPGVMQAALFGRQIHVCGSDAAVIEQGLEALCNKDKSLHWAAVESSLEDAFISLVAKSHGEF